MEEAEKVSSNERPSDEELLPEAEPMAIQDIRDALVIREGDLFLLSDVGGQVPRANTNGYGLYHRDTRYLSGYEFSFSSVKPLLLLSTAEMGYGSEQVMTNLTMVDLEGRRVPRATIEVRRFRVLRDVLEETVRIMNHNPFPVELEVVFRLAADFADIFEVRGYEPEFRGEINPPVWSEPVVTMSYKGRDGRTRQTLVHFEPAPALVSTDLDVAFVTFRVSLGRQQSTNLRVLVSLDGRMDSALGVERLSAIASEYEDWFGNATRVESDNEFFNAVLNRSWADIRMLWNKNAIPPYPSAGTPWFDTMFGRDTAIVGLQTLAFRPDIARDCLGALARSQGKKFDPWRDEEPGKIAHEMRAGELTQTGELPFSPYYGSIDSTPLFLLLAGEYYEWTADLDLMRQLETNLRAALNWLKEYGDADGDCYIEYEKRSVKGLVNQGWKDSSDAIIHRDGSLMEPPIALVEVQAYTYAVRRKIAAIFRDLGDEKCAAELERDAAELWRRFNADFWLAGEGCYGLALDGKGRRSASIASNAGHALWGGIATPIRARKVARRLMAEDMFSGWGIRTLSSLSPRFNPQGYHLGAVWPHDNSIIAMGFKRYGLESELNALATSLFEAARMFPYYRLPELFSGSLLSAHQTPVPYPVACRPQAWAAGAFPLITQAILGLCPDAPNRRLLLVRPALPDFVRRVRLEKLRVGRSEADLLYERVRDGNTRVKVLSVRGDLQVEKVRRWPIGGEQASKRKAVTHADLALDPGS